MLLKMWQEALCSDFLGENSEFLFLAVKDRSICSCDLD